MFFSIIVPTKNRPLLLRRALTSILNQDFIDFELIIVDDGDGSGMELAKGLADTRITTLSSAQAGQVAARNLALSTARGAHIAWLDDDDWFEPFHLTGLADVLTKHDGAAYVSGWIATEDDGGNQLSILPFSAHATPESLRENNTLLLSGLAYPRRYHDLFGAFDTSMAYYWDWDWYLRLADAGIEFYPAQRPSVWISARASSVSADHNSAARRAELNRLEAKHGLGRILLKNHASIAAEQAQST